MPPPDPGRRAVLSRDTDPVVERRQVSLWCRMSADARLESAAAACTETLRLSLAGIHMRRRTADDTLVFSHSHESGWARESAYRIWQAAEKVAINSQPPTPSIQSEPVCCVSEVWELGIGRWELIGLRFSSAC